GKGLLPAVHVDGGRAGRQERGQGAGRADRQDGDPDSGVHEGAGQPAPAATHAPGWHAPGYGYSRYPATGSSEWQLVKITRRHEMKPRRLSGIWTNRGFWEQFRNL